LDDSPAVLGKMNKTHEVSHKTHASEGSITPSVSSPWPASSKSLF
jgi:hypothetical protein